MSPLDQDLDHELASLKAADRLRRCPEMSGLSRTHGPVDGAPSLAFSSNDYLGLATHPALALAAAQSLATTGFGSGASRLVSGDFSEHRDLESALARYLQRPAALLFPTGYQANLGVFSALAGPQDLVVSDASNHASIIDGCRLSKPTVSIYPHANATAAAQALAAPGSFRRRFLVTESLFSMDGDAAPLAALADAARAAQAIFVVDEAHAFGVLGPSGRGLSAAAGIFPDVLVATLGKAFGTFGGFVAGSPQLRAILVNRARTFIFTTAPPPSLAAAACAALALVAGTEGDRLRTELQARTRRLHDRLRGTNLLPPWTLAGPIVPLLAGTDAAALALAARLRQAGIFVQPIRPPTVPEGTARLRVTLSAAHTDDDVDRLAEALLGA